MRIALFALALTLAAPDGGASTATLRVKVRGLRSGSGQVGCTLFNSAAGFPGEPDKAVKKMLIPIVKSATGFDATCEFPELKPGVYAVSVMHDENGDGTLDTGLFHIPKEGYGASRDQLPRMSAPSFDDNRLVLSAGVTEIDVHLRYP